MIYKLTVSRPTRKGSMVLVERVVQSDASQPELYGKFLNDYTGFNISVTEIEKIEVVDIPTKQTSVTINAKKPEVINSIDIRVNYNDKERELLCKYKECITNALSIKHNLVEMVKMRYEEKYNYLGYTHMVDLCLSSDYPSPKINVRLYEPIKEIEKKISEAGEIETQESNNVG